MLNGIKEFLLAPRSVCMGCGSVLGTDKDWLCSGCYAALSPLYTQNKAAASICAACGEIYTGGTCKGCGKRNVKLLTAAAPYDYVEPVRSMIHRFKFSGVWRMSRWMAGEMNKALESASVTGFTLIVPVPLHRLRRFERGYNQAEKLAEQLALITGKPTENALKRIRYTRRQVSLSAEQRRKNLDGAFKAMRDLTGERVLLVDDVRTTGTTVVRCADALLTSGAEEVIILTVAAGQKFVPASKKYHPDRGVKTEKLEREDF